MFILERWFKSSWAITQHRWSESRNCCPRSSQETVNWCHKWPWVCPFCVFECLAVVMFMSCNFSWRTNVLVLVWCAEKFQLLPSSLLHSQCFFLSSSNIIKCLLIVGVYFILCHIIFSDTYLYFCHHLRFHTFLKNVLKWEVSSLQTVQLYLVLCLTLCYVHFTICCV